MHSKKSNSKSRNFRNFNGFKMRIWRIRLLIAILLFLAIPATFFTLSYQSSRQTSGQSEPSDQSTIPDSKEETIKPADIISQPSASSSQQAPTTEPVSPTPTVKPGSYRTAPTPQPANMLPPAPPALSIAASSLIFQDNTGPEPGDLCALMVETTLTSTAFKDVIVYFDFKYNGSLTTRAQYVHLPTGTPTRVQQSANFIEPSIYDLEISVRLSDSSIKFSAPSPIRVSCS